MPLKTRLLTLVVIITNVLGNLALSIGMKAQAAFGTGELRMFVRSMFSPMVLLGVALLILWLLSRMALMSWADLSYILPITSVGYVLSALAGKFFLAETISTRRWSGTLLIVLGIVLVSFTKPKTSLS